MAPHRLKLTFLALNESQIHRGDELTECVHARAVHTLAVSYGLTDICVWRIFFGRSFGRFLRGSVGRSNPEQLIETNMSKGSRKGPWPLKKELFCRSKKIPQKFGH